MMTTKQMLTAVIAANISAEVTEKAQAMLNTAENRTGKRAEEQSANRTANVGIARNIAALMTAGTVYAASEIVDLMKAGGIVISTSKVTAVCKVGAAEGILEVVENHKVGGKGRAVKGYKIATGTAVDDGAEDSADESADDMEDDDE